MRGEGKSQDRQGDKVIAFFAITRLDSTHRIEVAKDFEPTGLLNPIQPWRLELLDDTLLVVGRRWRPCAAALCAKTGKEGEVARREKGVVRRGRGEGGRERESGWVIHV